MGLKRIAVICGGFSREYEVSIKSANSILSWLDKNIFEPYKVIIEKEFWYVDYKGKQYNIDKSDFSFCIDNCKIQFDYAYITIHGTPGEDGIIQGYLDIIGIPYNTSDVLTEALSFNKYVCNRYLSSFPNINTAKAIRITKNGDYTPSEIVSEIGLPLFIKPNVGGSSLATTKVKKISDIQGAIDTAIKEAHDVIIEEFISGKEVTCGCYKIGEKIHTLPITEVVSKNEFFDYNAKYKGEVEEITPARISNEKTNLIQSITKEIYKNISARGIIRVDYIIKDDGSIYLLEVNTTPGMTQTSFIPQQIVADKKDITRFLTSIILDSPY